MIIFLRITLLILSALLPESLRLHLSHERSVVGLLLKFIACTDSLNFVANGRNYFPNYLSRRN